MNLSKHFCSISLYFCILFGSVFFVLTYLTRASDIFIVLLSLVFSCILLYFFKDIDFQKLSKTFKILYSIFFIYSVSYLSAFLIFNDAFKNIYLDNKLILFIVFFFSVYFISLIKFQNLKTVCCVFFFIMIVGFLIIILCFLLNLPYDNLKPIRFESFELSQTAFYTLIVFFDISILFLKDDKPKSLLISPIFYCIIISLIFLFSYLFFGKELLKIINYPLMLVLDIQGFGSFFGFCKTFIICFGFSSLIIKSSINIKCVANENLKLSALSVILCGAGCYIMSFNIKFFGVIFLTLSLIYILIFPLCFKIKKCCEK